MKNDFQKLPLRDGVGIVVLNSKNKVFVAKRIDNPKNFWQMPHGGIDTGEDFLSAAYRELEEETSITKVDLIKEFDDKNPTNPYSITKYIGELLCQQFSKDFNIPITVLRLFNRSFFFNPMQPIVPL